MGRCVPSRGCRCSSCCFRGWYYQESLETLLVLEYATPEILLSNEGSSFSQMVQSTGPANAQYLWALVFEGKDKNLIRKEIKMRDGQRRWIASSRWAAAAQCALAISLMPSQNDLQKLDTADENNILKKTKDAVITLQNCLVGKHDKVIDVSCCNNTRFPHTDGGHLYTE